MASVRQLAARPSATADPTKSSRYRTVGLGLAAVGLMGAAASVIGNFAAAAGIDADNSYRQTLGWTFGLSIFSFGLIKIAIAIILMGIIVRLWFRVDGMKSTLPTIRAHTATGGIESKRGTARHGKVVVTDSVPKAFLIHRMAGVMWRPMLTMGAAALTAGLVSSWVWASETVDSESFRQAAAFTQGIEFLGETLLLTGISFLLGTIMAGLRQGGGEVQASLGLAVTTLKMPATAKAFVGLMMMGMMVGISQFVLYLVALGSADDPASFASWSNWLGPFRELALGLILAGIVLALVTIGNVLGFQFDRVKTIIGTGS